MRIDWTPYAAAAFAPDTGATTEAPASSDAEANASDAADDADTDDQKESSAAASGDAADQDWSLDSALGHDDALNEAMDRVGANMGRSPEDDATGDPSSDASGDASSAASDDAEGATGNAQEATGEAEEATGEAPEDKVVESLMGDEADSEADASEGDASEAGAEAEADEDEAEDETEAEAGEAEAGGAEAEGEEDAEEEGRPLPSELADEAQMLFPNRVVETQGQLLDAVEQSRQHEQMFYAVDEIVEQDDALGTYLELRVQEDLGPARAARRAFDELLSAPDPNEDPKAWAQWKADREIAEREAEQDAQQEQSLDEAEERVQDQMSRSLQAARQQLGLSGEEYTRFVAEVQRLVAGDERGNVPSDFGKRMYVALHFEDILRRERQKAREEAHAEGRNEALDDQAQRRRGDGLPKPDGSRAPADDLSEEEERLERIGDSFSESGASVEDFSI